jgi:hypothetical protein
VVFAEEGDAEEDGEGSFEVEEQGAGDTGDAVEAEKHEDGRDDAAAQDERGHAGRVGAAQAPF